MVIFNFFKIQKNKDIVEIYDGVFKQYIIILFGVYIKVMVFIFENNVIDIWFIFDGSDNLEGFFVFYM